MISLVSIIARLSMPTLAINFPCSLKKILLRLAISNELEFTTENLAINEQELDVLTHMEGLSTEEIIDIYIDNEIK